MPDTIPARSPDGDEHHIVYEGPAHLIQRVEKIRNLPPAGDGQEWVLVHRPVERLSL